MSFNGNLGTYETQGREHRPLLVDIEWFPFVPVTRKLKVHSSCGIPRVDDTVTPFYNLPTL